MMGVADPFAGPRGTKLLVTIEAQEGEKRERAGVDARTKTWAIISDRPENVMTARIPP